MHLKRTWGYILMILLSVHLSIQDDVLPSKKKIMKAFSDLLDDKMTDFIENQMLVFLEDKLPKIVGKKIEEYVMERFDILEEKFEKVLAVCTNNCTNTNCKCDQGWNGYQCDQGKWSSWTAWGVCTATCGGGQRQRSRTCSKPASSHGDQTCPGSSTDTENCNQDACPLNECPTSDGFFVAPGGDQCFRWYGDQYRTFNEAKTWCQDQGLQLAEPDQAVAVAVRQYIVQNYNPSWPWYTWVGGRRFGEYPTKYTWLSTATVALPYSDPLWQRSYPLSNTEYYIDNEDTWSCLKLQTSNSELEENPQRPYADTMCTTPCFTLCQLI